MKKAALFAIVSSSLLLTGCELPGGLEGFLDWRDKFYLKITLDQVESWFFIYLILLAALGMAFALWGVLHVTRHQLYPWEGWTLIEVANLFMIGVLFIYFWINQQIIQKVMPDDLTIDKIFSSMHWELSTDMEKMVVASWGAVTTIALPYWVALVSLGLFLASLGAMTWGIIGRHIKGAVYTASTLIGAILFLLAYNGIVNVFGENYPTWDEVPGVEAFYNAFYTGFVWTTAAICFWVMPVAAAIATPHVWVGSVQPEHKSRKHVVEEKERKRDVSSIFAAVPVPEPTPNGHRNGGGNGRATRNGRRDDGARADWVEGRFRPEVIVPEDPMKRPRLPPVAGSQTNTPESPAGGKSPDSGDPQLPPIDIGGTSVGSHNTSAPSGSGQRRGQLPPTQVTKQVNLEERVETAHRAVNVMSVVAGAAITVGAPEVAPVMLPILAAGTVATHNQIDRKATASRRSKLPPANNNGKQPEKSVRLPPAQGGKG